MKRIESVANLLSSLSAGLAGLAMVAMMVQVTLDVALKYLFHAPIPATLETVASYYMVAVVYLPLGIVTRDHEHIEVELFTQGLGERALSMVKGLAGLLMIAYVAVLIYRGGGEAIRMTIIKESWETAIWDMYVWPSRWFVPIGCSVMMLYLIIHVVDNFAFFFGGRRIMTSGTGPRKMDLGDDD